MSAVMANEDSPFQNFLNLVNESLFGVLYTIQKTRKDDLVRLNILTGLASILLDFVQILPFFVHGYNWGNITLTWGRYVRYVQLQLQLTTWESFTAAFWASVVIVGLIFVVTGSVFYSLYKKNTPNPVASVALSLSYNVVLHILFIAGFKLLMTPWWCNSVTQKLFPFENVDCFSGDNLIKLIVGSIFAIILLVSVGLASLATVNLAPVPNDLFAVTTPLYRIAFYFTLVFMTINENLIAKLIGDPGNGEQVGVWWEALLNLIIMTVFFGVFVYFLPFQAPEGNLWRGGLIAAAWWVSACSFVAVNYSPNPNAENNVIDYVTLGGMLPAFAVGYFIISTRYLVFKSLAASLIEEIEEDFQSNELYRAKFGSKGDDLIVGGDRNPYIYLPEVLKKFGADITSIEITGRLLWHNSSAKKNVEASYRLYRRAEQAYPDVAFVKFLRANCLTYLSSDPSAFIDQIEGVKRLDPGFLVQFLVYKRDMETKYRGSMTKTEGNSATDMITYVEFQKYYAEAQKFNTLAITSIRNFWELFLQPTITFTAFNKASKAIELHTQKALSTYKTLIVRYPKHIYIISSYAYFLELVMHNAEEAERYHLRADQLRARENDENGLTESGIDSQAVITISEEGTIEQVNNATTKLFGWTRVELVTRNIKLIVPSPFKEKHDQFLDKYKSTGNAKVVGLPPRKVFGQHRDGYSIAINLQVAERRKENGARAFVGSLVETEVDADHGNIIINEDGIIILITKRITQMFGYSAVELLRNNITMCMIDAFAANHETYLRRYKETGEAKLIGTAGRNVPARRKDATVFPASLVVEEEYIGGQRFFVAQLLDTTHVTAIIYIDGMGVVQNCDQGISTLLGYKKEDLIGQNIRSVMPPPYNGFHDMYLERYRRTKVSNVLRSIDGRLLPALHADGSIVKIRLIVQRSDSGDSSDSLLFKGMIRRVDAELNKTSGGRVGFDDKNVIEMKKDGTIISVGKSVLNTLGYAAEKDPKDYFGQPIETLIPPVENRPQQQRSYWMAQALAAQDLNFYILLISKNFTLFPFTYNLSMKSPDVVLMRLRDIFCADALITIDEMGTILSSNEDSFLLLGHDPDEITGRNIKHIQSEENASQHDGYLLHYKETRVARAVGLARELSTIHRDKSVMPIEIQITEIKTADGNNFIGRLRHLPIEERVSQEFIESFYRTVVDEDLNSNLIKETNGSKSDFKNPFEAEEQADSKDVSMDGEDDESESGSDSSSSDEEDEENEALTADMEDKLALLKSVDKEMVSTRRLAYILYGTLAIVIATLIAGLISASITPSPEHLFVFLDELNLQSKIINRAIYTLRLGRFIEEAPLIIANMTNTRGSEGFWECSLGAPYNFTKGAVTVNVPVCAFVQKFHLKENLEDMIDDLVHSKDWISKNYPDIRTEGDAFDKIFQKKLDYKSYENGWMEEPVIRQFGSWSDFIESGFFDAISKLALNPVLDGSYLPTRLDFQFLQGNRMEITNRLSEIQETVFTKIHDLLATEALIHLVILILIIVTVGVSFGVFMIPVIRNVMSDRLLILKLLLLVPKHIIWDFVFTIYRDDSEDEFVGDEEVAGDTEKAKELEKAKAMRLKSEEVVDIVNDNVYHLYLFFGLGVLSITLPLLIHVIWRYEFNAMYNDEVDGYHDVSFLSTTANSLLWRATGLLAPCAFRVPTDQRFCGKMVAATADLVAATTKADNYLKALQNRFAGNEEIDGYFYNLQILDKVYKGCKEETVIQLKVDRTNFPDFDYPANLANGASFTVKEKDYRCIDNYENEKPGSYFPYAIRLPEDYQTKFTRGIANTLSIFFKYSYSFAETPGFNVTTPPAGPLSEFYFFTIFEAAERESREAILFFKDFMKQDLLNQYMVSRTAFTATYIVTIIYVIGLFMWIFESARRDLAKELQHNRGIIFMIPVAISAKSKPIVEYVERILTELLDK